jgi:universal stress protein E
VRSFERILIDVDPHAVHHPELDRGISIARATNAQVAVVAVMSSADLPAGSVTPITTEGIDQVKHLLEVVAAGVSGVSVSTKLLFGPPAEAMAEEVHRFGADLLVRSHSRDTVHPRGGIDRELIRRSPAPVLLVGPGIAPAHPRVLGAVAPDTGRDATTALNRAVSDYTLSMSAIEGGSATLFQAFRPPAVQLAQDSGIQAVGCVEQWRTEITAELARSVRELGEDPKKVALVARHGVVDDVLPEFIVSQGMDLVVIGVPPRRGLARWVLGSTAARLLRLIPCSVLAVKPDPQPSRYPVDLV